MPEPTPSRAPMAGGLFIALGAVIGPLIGFRFGSPSAGLVIGLGIGAAAAVALWLWDRRS